MQAALALPGMDATVIGEIVEGQGVSVVDQNGVELNVSHGGWDHFRT
jgi:thiamine monophosphate kinase